MHPNEPLHPEDLRRKELDGEIPTHPPDPAARGEQGKVVPDGRVTRVNDYNAPPPEGASKSTGAPLDDVGGPGLGLPPETQGGAAARRDQETKARDDHAEGSDQAG